MKNVVASSLLFLLTISVYAQDKKEKEIAPNEIMSLDEIINTESHLTSKKENESHYKSVWGKTKFLNISYNQTSLKSAQFPTAGGTYEREFKNEFGGGLQFGKTFNFNKKAIGTFLFIGLDYTGIDLNVNHYACEDASATYDMGSERPFCLPWHHEKWTLDYGMSLGPSLTLYPFTAIGKSGTDNIRIHAFFHVGYHLGLSMFPNVQDQTGKESMEVSWGNGLFTSFGGSLTWDFIGVGYEVRRATDVTLRATRQNFKTDNFKGQLFSNRIFLQFRF